MYVGGVIASVIAISSISFFMGIAGRVEAAK
jgi:hypothetical protein